MQALRDALNDFHHPRLLIGTSLVSLLALWGVFFLAPFRLTDTIPLHADAYFGIDAVGSGWWALVVPSVATLLAGLHFGLAFVFRSRDRIARLALLVSIPTVLTLGLLTIFWLLILMRYG